MAEWCKHDIDVSVSICGICQPAPAVEEVQPEHPGRWFQAAFDGECDWCGAAIREGSRIRPDGEGGWQCAGCAPEAAHDGAGLERRLELW